MGRPLKNNCEYFPHFTNMRNHRKVKALRNKFGYVLGYAFWAMFIEYLTELDGNEFEFTSIECEMFAGELGVSAAEISSIINYCLNIELLFKTDNNFVYSDSLNEYLKPVYEKRNREREKSKTRERRENGSFYGKEIKIDGVSAAEIPSACEITEEGIPQSKEEESKEDKSKKEKEKFDEFRIIYPGTKRGNETEFENFKRKHKDYKQVLVNLKKIIEDQIQIKKELKGKGKFVPEWKNLQTWINNRCWEEVFDNKILKAETKQESTFELFNKS